MLCFILSNDSVEKNINIQQALLFPYSENPDLKTKKIIKVNNLIIVLIKIEAINISQFGLACKHGIIFQISIYNWTQNCIL